MSTLKTNNVQVGQSVTATNNFTLYQPSSPDGTVRLGVGNTGATTLDVVTANSSGNVGIGVTPSAWGSNFKAVQIGLSGAVAGQTGARTLELVSNAYNNSGWKYAASDFASQYYQYNGGHYWGIAASGTSGNAISFTQAMTLDSGGNLLVGATSQIASGKIVLSYSGQLNNGIVYNDTYATSTTSACIFRRNGTQIGSIDTTPTATSYLTSSDYRLKENIQSMKGALAKVAELKPVTYRWKADGSDGQGFIAHELQEVCPDAVGGTKDAVDADGNPVYQGIDTSFLVATLTAAIQELKAEVDALKAQLAG